MHRITALIKQHPVLSYCTLVLTWSGIWWSLILTAVPLGMLMKPPFNPLALVYMLVGVLSPGIAGFVLSRIVYGKGAARALLARLGQWRNGRMWLALLIPWAVTLAPVLLYAQTGGAVAWAGMAAALPMAIGLGLFAGLFEEFGWRGFLLPRLQTRFSPFVSALLVGLVWGGLWHFYADWVATGDQGWRALLLIVLQAPLLLTADSVLLTWVYNRTRGSLLLCVLFHFSISASAFLFAVSYPTYEATLFWTALTVGLWCAVAGAVVLSNRRLMFATPSGDSPRSAPGPGEILAAPGQA